MSLIVHDMVFFTPKLCNRLYWSSFFCASIYLNKNSLKIYQFELKLPVGFLRHSLNKTLTHFDTWKNDFQYKSCPSDHPICLHSNKLSIILRKIENTFYLKAVVRNPMPTPQIKRGLHPWKNIKPPLCIRAQFSSLNVSIFLPLSIR